MKQDSIKSLVYLVAIAEDAEQAPRHTPNMQRVATRFGVNRSTVLRNLAEYQENGYLDEKYRLTEKGRKMLTDFRRHKEKLQKWMMANKISEESAEQNAYAILQTCSEDVVAFLCNLGGSSENREGLDGGPVVWRGLRGSASADILKQWFPDGNYQLHYAFLKTQPGATDRGRSMANEAFEYPARMEIRNGEGAVFLKRKVMRQQNMLGFWVEGMAAGLKYELSDGLHDAMLQDEELAIPMSAFYIAYEEGLRRVRLVARTTMTCTAGDRAMPEKQAYLEAWIFRNNSTAGVLKSNADRVKMEL